MWETGNVPIVCSRAGATPLPSMIQNSGFPHGNEEWVGEKWNKMVFLPSSQGCYDKVGMLSLWRKGLELGVLDCGEEAARRV